MVKTFLIVGLGLATLFRDLHSLYNNA